MSFVDPQVISSLSSLDRGKADALPHGAIKVDDSGTIQLYNRWESQLAGVPPAAAEGKNFFTQIAPCTNNRLVFGRFKDSVASGSLDFEIKYTFTYKMKPTNVTLRLVKDPSTKANWVFVKN
ncbi:MAG: photoactive yellow protein [Myxococcota bacterium]